MVLLKLNIIFIIYLITRVEKCFGDLFTAMADISTLFKTEGEMIKTIESYIQVQESKLSKLRRDLLEIEKVHDLTSTSPEQFFGNPLNSFLLVKRMTIDWADLKETLSSDAEGRKMLNNLTSIVKFPDEEDLNGMAVGLMRLQHTYQLDTAQLASGTVSGSHAAYRELTASDCFELGRQAYNTEDYHHTTLWMTEALSRHDKENKPTTDLFDILEYLAFSSYKEKHIEKALQLTERMLRIRPDHSRALVNKGYYEKMINEQRGDPTVSLDDSVKKGYAVRENKNPSDPWTQERMVYERLCRGESKLTPAVTKNFKCRYQFGPSKFLRLAPVKLEVAHIHPTIVIFHDVIYDSEIEAIKQLASPRFARATVSKFPTGELITASYRISKSAWLKQEFSPYVKTVNDRISLITGLDVNTAEELQVANYGIGGHYEPHFDYSTRDEEHTFASLGTGNRIATFLFYMSDVEAGGKTVFPRIELALTPKKGAAAFWFNLMPNSDGDALTRHAACPVLIGSKWVSNKWLHERGQEFRRPCGLTQDAPSDLIR